MKSIHVTIATYFSFLSIDFFPPYSCHPAHHHKIQAHSHHFGDISKTDQINTIHKITKNTTNTVCSIF